MQIVTLKFRGFPTLRFGRVYFEPEKKRPPISLVGWPPMEEKTPVWVGHQPHRKVGIRPCNVDQPPRASLMSVQVFVRQAALNGRMPTFRAAFVVRHATGVFFFQGGCKTQPPPSSSGLGVSRPHARHGVGRHPWHMKSVQRFARSGL